MPKKEAEADETSPKAGRQAKRKAATATDNDAGPPNEVPAAKRPCGRPPKALTVEQPAPMPVATTPAQKSRKKADARSPLAKTRQQAKLSRATPRI
ncbi:hypothetical protein MRX96_056889 [Rhipicephalus microplus]